MRRTAYLKALEEASKLPESIPELARYFDDSQYNPQQLAITYIKTMARLDTKYLFSSELIEILNWEKPSAKGNNYNASAEQATSEEDRINT